MTRRTSFRYGKIDNHADKPPPAATRAPPNLRGAAKRNQMIGQAKAAAEGRGPRNWKPPAPVTLARVALADPTDFDD